MTRRTKFSAVVLAEILIALRKGNTLDAAAYTAGIHPRTLRQWMAEKEDVDFAIAQAQATRESVDVEALDQAIAQGGKLAVETAKWRLAALNPAVWGRASRNDMWTLEQKVKALAEELRREGMPEHMISERQLMKDYVELSKTKSTVVGELPPAPEVYDAEFTENE